MPENKPKAETDEERARFRKRDAENNEAALIRERACFLLEDDPPEQHGKPIACTQCWNALSAEVEELRRKAAAFDYIDMNHTSTGGQLMSDDHFVGLVGIVGRGRTLLEAAEAEIAKAEAAWAKYRAAGLARQPKPRD